MTMCRYGLLCRILFILVTVFSLTNSSNITDVTEGSNVSLPTTNRTAHRTSRPPPLLHHPSIISPPSSPTSPSPVTLPFTAVYDQPRASGLDSSSLAGVAFPIKVQKCCKTNQVLELGQYNSQCVDSTEKLVVDVFLANSTHYWNYTKTTRRDVVVVTNNPCTQSKYFLDPESDQNDTFHVLHNSSLYVPYNMEMFGPDSYCVDLLQTASNFITTAVICTPTPPDGALHFFFGTGLVLSVISLSLLSFYTMWRDDWLDDHKKCLAFFSGTMALSFFFIAISVFFGRYLPNIVNILIAYIVYYLKLNYFIWVTVLCYDTWKCVKTATDGTINKGSYLKWYMLAAYSIPILFILVNLVDKYNPALPNLYLEFSYSSSFVWGLTLFYVPNIITGILNIYIMTSIVLPQGKCKNFNEMLTYLQSERWKPTPAPENIVQLKNMYRRTFLLCILLLAFLILDLVIFLLPSKGQQQAHFIIRDVVYCMQGVFIACMFIRKDCWKRTPTNLNETEMNLLKTNDNGLCA